MEALSYALEIASVPEDETVLFQAADYIEQHDLTAFDARRLCRSRSNNLV